jgi:CLIP-associating protein 1/2
MLFERFLREGGLGSKVWRSREQVCGYCDSLLALFIIFPSQFVCVIHNDASQAILTLVRIRRAHHLFPIRPYLPLLVDTLEDTDAHVRECARQSVVELFTGPAVSDAARADLKKEMTKKSVRKAIVDDVLSKLLAGSGGGAGYPPSEGSENGEAGPKQREYVPPSLALLGRKAPGSSGGLSRTVSHGSLKEISRPASRAEAPTPFQVNDSVDIRAVYVSPKSFLGVGTGF